MLVSAVVEASVSGAAPRWAKAGDAVARIAATTNPAPIFNALISSPSRLSPGLKS
jgi:hypothetical protein